MTESHEHRPTYWNYLCHHDKTNRHRNWTGQHTLVCRQCGADITRRRTTPSLLKNTLPALALLVFLWLGDGLFSDRRVWLAVILVLALGLSFLTFRTARFETLEDYYRKDDQDEEDA